MVRPDIHLPKSWQCVSCGHLARDNFCSSCGERRPDGSRLVLGHLIAEGLEAVLHLDAKLLLSLRTLLFRPGLLAADFFRGRRRPYLGPLQLFLVCNLVFFVIQPITGLNILSPSLNSQLERTTYAGVARHLTARHLAATGANMEEFALRFDRLTEILARSLVILMVPLFSGASMVLYRGARRLFVEHLVLALHLYSFWLLWLSIVFVATAMSGLIAPGLIRTNIHMDGIVSTAEFLAFGVYLALALKTAFGDRRAGAAMKALLLTAVCYGVLHIYRFILFLITLYAT